MMNKSEIILFNEKKECCACGACKNICPQKAIFMEEDEYGFKYPKINYEKCIKCELCKKVCFFQNKVEKNIPIDTYVAFSKDKNTITTSASGGAFSTIARKYLNNNAVVFGAAFDNKFNLKHIGVTDENYLYKLQGSKYVQSDIGKTYREAKELLETGVQVLFSGTPCQIAGLKGYLMREYDNLTTIDLICHGVPNNKFFKDYLKLIQKKINGKIKEFRFRDKSIGWGLNGSITYEVDGMIRKKRIYSSESSYYYYFSNSECYRESCYSCKYAGENRPADITIGDYWGIEIVHPELLKNKMINEEKGISVLIANTEKGNRIAKRCEMLQLYNSEFQKARFKNTQLNEPSSKGDNYYRIMNQYKDKGYEEIDAIYNKEIGIRRYKNRIKSLIPMYVKRKIKQMIK